MRITRQKIIVAIAGVALLTLGGAIWFMLEEPVAPTTPNAASAPVGPVVQQPPPPNPDSGAPSDQRASVPSPNPIRLDVEKTLSQAQLLSLQVLEPGSFTASKGAIALLKLNASEIQEVNKGLQAFKQKLLKEELARAVVEITPEGAQEIVVPKFDRQPFYTSLESQLAAKIRPEAAQILTKLLGYEQSLGTSDTELRVVVFKGEDGTERMEYTRTVLHRNVPAAANGGIAGASLAMPLTNSTLLSDRVEPRFLQLIKAAKTLPKRPVPVGAR